MPAVNWEFPEDRGPSAFKGFNIASLLVAASGFCLSIG
jgi:hypothetical protein